METTKRQEAINRLLSLLTNGAFDKKPERDFILARCILADENPRQYIEKYDEDFAFLLEDAPEKILETAVLGDVAEHVYFSDKADELHQQIKNQFEKALPDYPSHSVTYAYEYYEWLKEQLDAIDSELVPVLFACSYSDELQVVIVRKQALMELSMLCEELDIHFESLFEITV